MGYLYLLYIASRLEVLLLYKPRFSEGTTVTAEKQFSKHRVNRDWVSSRGYDGGIIKQGTGNYESDSRHH